MFSAHTPTLEIENLDQWDRQIAAGQVRSLAGWVVQSVDLRERAHDLTHINPHGALFLGCSFDSQTEDYLREHGALIFPQLPSVPFDAYRNTLYQATDLYDAVIAGKDYSASTDARIYTWVTSQPTPPSVYSSLAMSLHDALMCDVFDDTLAKADPLRCVGVMGGHAIERGSDDYIGAARLGSQLALADFTVVTGGGPGSMEAANLGAYCAGQYAVLTAAIDRLSSCPSFSDDATLWIAIALEVKAGLRAQKNSFSVPTWFYGHEPSNVFSNQIAKFFSNAIREDLLLTRCQAGIIYLPGAAGTVQEIFQMATNNYYAADPSKVVPMVFVKPQYWTSTLPVWPLISTLGSSRVMGERLWLAHDVDEAADIIATVSSQR